ncbi:MAG: energy transducer TonB [Sphingomonadales bacterium]|nr:energy transducer TonB [Sphingomonadales bacterium]MDE2568082.1 energy transducer TonB [Sphingomonadales bacterium]
MKKALMVAPLLAILAASPLRAATPSPPRPANPGEWIKTDDYPDEALQAGRQGSVRFTLQVDANGMPSGCNVVQGSGDPSLDEATCRLISQRARFTPATGRNGKPVAGSYTNTVRWVLPADAPAPVQVRIDPMLIAPDYCIPVWKGDNAARLSAAALARCKQ